jgi:hypothetical protein
LSSPKDQVHINVQRNKNVLMKIIPNMQWFYFTYFVQYIERTILIMEIVPEREDHQIEAKKKIKARKWIRKLKQP